MSTHAEVPDAPDVRLFTRQATGLRRDVSPLSQLVFCVFTAPTPFILTIALFWILGAFPGANLYVALIGGYLAGIVFCFAISLVSAAIPRTGGDYIFVGRIIKPIVGTISSFCFTGGRSAFSCCDQPLRHHGGARAQPADDRPHHRQRHADRMGHDALDRQRLAVRGHGVLHHSRGDRGGIGVEVVVAGSDRRRDSRLHRALRHGDSRPRQQRLGLHLILQQLRAATHQRKRHLSPDHHFHQGSGSQRRTWQPLQQHLAGVRRGDGLQHLRLLLDQHRQRGAAATRLENDLGDARSHGGQRHPRDHHDR